MRVRAVDGALDGDDNGAAAACIVVIAKYYSVKFLLRSNQCHFPIVTKFMFVGTMTKLLSAKRPMMPTYAPTMLRWVAFSPNMLIVWESAAAIQHDHQSTARGYRHRYS